MTLPSKLNYKQNYLLLRILRTILTRLKLCVLFTTIFVLNYLSIQHLLFFCSRNDPINIIFYVDDQIREKLKSRKLPASGPKSELVTRLFDSLMAEERLLEEGPGGESIDLSGVNMDEVLGLDDEKDTHSSITANEDIEEGKEKQPARFF